jgi:hypothetical protein
MNTSRIAAMAGVVAIALTGCGGSSNKQLSYSDFVAKANKLCSDGQAALTKATSASDSAKTLADYTKKFKDLKPPDQLKPAHDQFVQLSEQQLVLLKKGDTAGANVLSKKSDEVASKMGTQDCISQG